MIASGDWWRIDDDGTLYVYCVGDMPDYERGWNEPPWDDFPYRNSITSISISDSVTSIGSAAFNNCYNLISVTIPSSVTSIGYEAFTACSSLENLILSDSVTIIGSYAFFGAGHFDESVDDISVGNVYYTGTEAQWNKIYIESSNDPLFNATIHYNYAPTPPPVPVAPGAFTVAVSYTRDGQTFTTSFSLNMAAEYYAVTPPTKTTYVAGETLDATGLSIIYRSSDGTETDITANCTLSPAAGTPVTEAATVSVQYDGAEIGSFDVTCNAEQT